MITNIERIKNFDTKELAQLLTKLDMFCELCAYDLRICKRKCEEGHEIWLEQKYTENQKEKLTGNR